MGQLDEKAFADTIAKCGKCGMVAAFEVRSYLDRQLSVMLGEANDDGRWTHDGEKFIDGIFSVKCRACGAEAFASKDCPRCHRADGLADALEHVSRLAVPKRCPTCKGMELTIVGFAPSVVSASATTTRPQPAATALLGEPGFHVAHIMCDGCDWVAIAEGCPMCGGAGPLRKRPG